jgi:hypothetical protein
MARAGQAAASTTLKQARWSSPEISSHEEEENVREASEREEGKDSLTTWKTRGKTRPHINMDARFMRICIRRTGTYDD